MPMSEPESGGPGVGLPELGDGAAAPAYDLPDAAREQMRIFQQHAPVLRTYQVLVDPASAVGTAVLSTNVRLVAE